MRTGSMLVPLGVNFLYAGAATYGARRCTVSLDLLRGVPLAILVTGTTSECAIMAINPGEPRRVLLLIGLGAAIIAAASDAATGYIFDSVTLPALAAMAVVSIGTHTFAATLAGSAAAGGSLALLYLITRGRGLGFGDVKLACCIGAAMGCTRSLQALAAAFILGGAYAAYLLLVRRADGKREIRFAPYLAAGMMLSIVHGAIW